MSTSHHPLSHDDIDEGYDLVSLIPSQSDHISKFNQSTTSHIVAVHNQHENIENYYQNNSTVKTTTEIESNDIIIRQSFTPSLKSQHTTRQLHHSSNIDHVEQIQSLIDDEKQQYENEMKQQDDTDIKQHHNEIPIDFDTYDTCSITPTTISLHNQNGTKVITTMVPKDDIVVIDDDNVQKHHHNTTINMLQKCKSQTGQYRPSQLTIQQQEVALYSHKFNNSSHHIKIHQHQRHPQRSTRATHVIISNNDNNTNPNQFSQLFDEALSITASQSQHKFQQSVSQQQPEASEQLQESIVDTSLINSSLTNSSLVGTFSSIQSPHNSQHPVSIDIPTLNQLDVSKPTISISQHDDDNQQQQQSTYIHDGTGSILTACSQNHVTHIMKLQEEIYEKEQQIQQLQMNQSNYLQNPLFMQYINELGQLRSISTYMQNVYNQCRNNDSNQLEDDNNNVSEVVKENTILKHQICQYQLQLDTISNQKNELSQQLIECQKLKDQLRVQCTTLQTQLQTNYDQHAILLIENGKLATKLQMAQYDANILTTEKDELIVKLQTCQDEMDQLSIHHTILSTQLQSCQDENVTLITQNDDLTIQLQSCQDENIVLTTQNDDLIIELQTCQDEKDELTAQLATATVDNETLTKQLQELQSAPITWSFNEQGHWIGCDSAMSTDLEHHYQEYLLDQLNKAKQIITLKSLSNNKEYSINFPQMIQKNTETGFARSLKR